MNKIKNVGKLRISTSEHIIKPANIRKEDSIINHQLSWETIILANKINKFYYLSKNWFVNFISKFLEYFLLFLEYIFNEFLTVEKMRFRPAILFDSYLLNFSQRLTAKELFPYIKYWVR